MTDIELKKHVGRQLRATREANGWEVKEVGQMLKISANQISQQELGYIMPSIPRLKKYCELYKITSADILPF